MNVMQLQAAKTEIEHLIARKAVEEREALTAHITEMAAARGFSLDELLGKRRIGKMGKVSKVAPKYRNHTYAASSGAFGRMARKGLVSLTI